MDKVFLPRSSKITTRKQVTFNHQGPRSSNTHVIDLGTIKDTVYYVVARWFLTCDLWMSNPVTYKFKIINLNKFKIFHVNNPDKFS